MIYSLAVYSPPGINSLLALEFAECLLRQGHGLERVFFFSEGVKNCSTDEGNLPWRNFIQQHQVDAVVCIASAHKRGIIDPTTARQRGDCESNLAEEFSIGGLGQLIDAGLSADRFITFAGNTP